MLKEERDAVKEKDRLRKRKKDLEMEMNSQQNSVGPRKERMTNFTEEESELKWQLQKLEIEYEQVYNLLKQRQAGKAIKRWQGTFAGQPKGKEKHERS